MRAALLVVDVQRDFCEGGALAVREGDEVVPQLNKVIAVFEALGLPIFYTRDWHPANHISFKAQGGSWPPHCVQGTAGAKFHPDLRVPPDPAIISKAEDPSKEAYSDFEGTNLRARLKGLGVDEVFIGGLATEYCIRATALDARRAGFGAEVLTDCIRPIDVKPGDGDRALAEMEAAGARLTTSSEAIDWMAAHSTGPRDST